MTSNMCELVSPWTAANIGSQKGKTVIITGANSGIGFFVAKYLGQAGATVILACRNEKKGLEAIEKLKTSVSQAVAVRGTATTANIVGATSSSTALKGALATDGGSFELRLLDLSSLKDVERFADEFNAEGRPLDILINNAGIMMPPYEKSIDGFESQMAANYLGHFVLTQKLMPSLKLSSQKNAHFALQGFPRVVSVSSIIAWRGKQYKMIDYTKEGFSRYNAPEVYAETKLGALLFMRELGKRYPTITSVAAHPGVASSNLHKYKFGEFLWAMQSPESGALPILRAACDPNAKSGAYFAPRGLGYAGYPNKGILPFAARDAAYCKRYWDSTCAAVKPILDTTNGGVALSGSGGNGSNKSEHLWAGGKAPSVVSSKAATLPSKL